MQRAKSHRRHRATHLGLTVALLGLVMVLTVAPSPVKAAGGGCETLSGWDAAAGSYISASRYRFCGETEIPLPVRIERYLSPGVWETVASGTGDVVYNCSGSSFNRYRIPFVTGEFEILCS